MTTRGWLALALALVGNTASACEHPQEVAPPAAPVAPTEPAPKFDGNGTSAPAPMASWSGIWKTSYGALNLVQQGGSVTGEYTYENNGVPITGHLTGTATGLRLEFAWDEPPGGAGAGHGVFVMSPDGASFDGTWGQGNSRTDGGSWTGTR